MKRINRIPVVLWFDDCLEIGNIGNMCRVLDVRSERVPHQGGKLGRISFRVGSRYQHEQRMKFSSKKPISTLGRPPF